MRSFKLKLLYKDNHIEEINVIRFSDLSTDLKKSRFYYYETNCHLKGKGVCIDRGDLKCFEVVPYE